MFVSEFDTVAQIVGRNFTAAEIFEELGIDYCCKGHLTLSEACRKNDLDVAGITAILGEMHDEARKQVIDLSTWPIDLLVNFIEKTHHRNIKSRMPRIQNLLTKLVNRHGNRHPELVEMRNVFIYGAELLAHHIQKEEEILFPYICELYAAQRLGHIQPVSKQIDFLRIIELLEQDHTAAIERFEILASLSADFTSPVGVCATWTIVFAELKNFAEELRRHIYLENYLLFPAALELEKIVLQKL